MKCTSQNMVYSSIRTSIDSRSAVSVKQVNITVSNSTAELGSYGGLWSPYIPSVSHPCTSLATRGPVPHSPGTQGWYRPALAKSGTSTSYQTNHTALWHGPDVHCDTHIAHWLSWSLLPLLRQFLKILPGSEHWRGIVCAVFVVGVSTDTGVSVLVPGWLQGHDANYSY